MASAGRRRTVEISCFIEDQAGNGLVSPTPVPSNLCSVWYLTCAPALDTDTRIALTTTRAAEAAPKNLL
jgi:hypothetical protein